MVYLKSHKAKANIHQDELGAIISNIKRIFIIDHSDAGKDVLAQAVAKNLGWKFINADVLGCATHIGRTPSEVLGTEGENCTVIWLVFCCLSA